MQRPSRLPKRGAPAPVVLPFAASALLGIGALVAATDGGIGPTAVLVLTSVVVSATALLADLPTLAMTVLVAEFTAIGFTRAPYAQLRGGPLVWHAGLTLVAVASVSFALAVTVRYRRSSGRTLEDVPQRGWSRPSGRALVELGAAVGLRRQLAAALFAAAALPLLTLALTGARKDLSLADDLLLYLIVVVVVSLVGGFWPAVVTAAASGLLLNWYLTPPVHTLTIDKPENLLALLLFVVVAMIVSSVVHLSARRAADSASSSKEAATLLELARTVLAGADTPTSVLAQLTDGRRMRANLLERVSGSWAIIAQSGVAPEEVLPSDPVTTLALRSDLRLRLAGDWTAVSPRVIEGIGAQAAAALDRERLRTQAAQAEALGEANRVRTALLTAVSHDLRTPLASVKAAITSLRQGDVTWSKADEAALLATIEEGSDRLEVLINNLLDMSRIHTGSLQPFLRPTALDEVVPMALRGVADADVVELDIPDTLPLVATDAALLERVVANLVANAVHFRSGGPVRVVGEVGLDASGEGEVVRLSVVDHGPGVPDSQRGRMFEPFQRLGDRPAGSGVGLGLAVARGLTEAMGGLIQATGTPGGGLTMTVELRTDALVSSR